MSVVIQLDEHRARRTLAETGVERVYEPLPDPAQPQLPAPRSYDLQLVAQLVNTLGVPVNEEALEAAFHVTVEQSRSRNVRVEDALELAAYAVLNYERGRRDTTLYQDRPF